MKDVKFAAIDIGSNAVRLLLARVFETEGEPVFKKESLVRMPIRLGDEVFQHERITKRTVDRLVQTMTAFKLLIEAYEAIDYAACATSAMRDAANGSEVVARVREESAINLNLIDGRREAEIIFEHHLDGSPFKDHSALYIDVGGGSTEITAFDGTDSVRSASFNIGSIRLLRDLVTEAHWQEMKKWLKETASEVNPEMAVGTGGNINKVFRLLRQKEGRPITRNAIKNVRQTLAAIPYEDRITHLQLRPDRADVIIPAIDIFTAVMKWGKVKDIYVPQVGLSDGLIRVLYNEYRAKQAVS